MKKSKLLPFLYAGVLSFTAVGMATIITPKVSSIVTVAQAADSQIDLSDRAAGLWALTLYGTDLSYQDADNNFYKATNTLRQPTKIPTTAISNYTGTSGTAGKQFNVAFFQISTNNSAIVSYEQWYSEAYQTTVSEYNPDGKIVPNASLKIQPADDNASENYSTIEGISTVQPDDVVIVQVTPAKASLKGHAYFFFNGTGIYNPNISYSYAFDSATTQTKITDPIDSSTIIAPTGAKTLQLNQTGYIDPKWAGGDANVKIDSNGKITGLDNPDELGKTVSFTITHGIDSSITHTFNVKIPAKVTPNGGGGNNGGNSGGSGTVVVPTNNGSNTTPTSSSSSSSATTSSSRSSTTAPTTEPVTPTTIESGNKGIAAKGAAVYATKGIYLYKNANFNKNQRIAKYPKAKRVNRPMFVVTGYAYTKNGTLRYKVRDVNHGTKTANKRGYITANKKYVVNVYYSSMPKNKKTTVIATKGANAYKRVNLTSKVKHYKKGVRLTVKKIVKHNLTTRYQLSNGNYITANKKFIIQGNY